MKIAMIAALGKNRELGEGNKLIWKIPLDLKRFQDLTSGHPIIMGRKTYESIGRLLPNRTNIIITRDHDYEAEGCIVAHSADEALNAAKSAEEAMVIGGSQIYKEFLPMANRMHLTIIDADFEGDAYFPEYSIEEWEETEYEEHERDAENKYNYAFITLERK